MRDSLEPKQIRWLGRQDSNLRMPVPKTGVSHAVERDSVQNDALVHKLESIACRDSAERGGLFMRIINHLLAPIFLLAGDGWRNNQ